MGGAGGAGWGVFEAEGGSGASFSVTFFNDGVIPFTVSTYATAGYVYSDCNIGWEGDGRQFAGGISTIRVYNNALTGEEVLQNYNAQKNRHGR